MKYIWLLLASTLLLTGCNWVYQVGGPPEGVSEGNSSVPNDFHFITQHGEEMTTDDLRNTYWIANFIFTECPSVCPMMTPNMQALQEFTMEEDLPVQYISFTVDPDADDPERLKKYGQNMGANFDSWNFVTGYSPEEISSFSQEAFLSPVQPLEDGRDIMHSTRFFLIDPNGDVIRLYDGLTVDQSPIQEDLIDVISGSS